MEMNFFRGNFLKGKKTYITGWLAIAAGVVEVVQPGLLPVSVADPGELIVMGLGFVFLRKGIG